MRCREYEEKMDLLPREAVIEAVEFALRIGPKVARAFSSSAVLRLNYCVRDLRAWPDASIITNFVACRWMMLGSTGWTRFGCAEAFLAPSWPPPRRRAFPGGQTLHMAMQDLKIDRLDVIHAGYHTFPSRKTSCRFSESVIRGYRTTFDSTPTSRHIT